MLPCAFYRIVDQAQGRYEIHDLSPSKHPAALYLNHLQVHGANVDLYLHRDQTRLEQQIRNGAHLSARKRVTFFCAEVLNQVHKRHLLVLPLAAVKELPSLWLSPAACIPQDRRQDRPIYDYTFSGLNKAVTPTAPHDAMQFDRA